MKSTPLLMPPAAAAGVFLLVLSGGCASPDATPDALSSRRCEVFAEAREPAGERLQSYRFARFPDASKPNLDPRSRAAAAYVRQALASWGMYEAGAWQEPDVTIDFDYGVDVKHRRTGGVRKRVWVKRTANGDKVVSSAAASVPGATPTTAAAAYVTLPQVITEYEKYFQLTARRVAEDVGGRATPRLVWAIIATSRDGQNDLDACLPYLVAAAMDYCGRTTAEPVLLAIGPDDARLALVQSAVIE